MPKTLDTKTIKGGEQHRALILKLLKTAIKPLTAYQLLEKMAGHGIKGPPIVYRALQRLQTEGKIHRIESINAFVLCHAKHEADCGGKHHHHAAALMVCKKCGEVTELLDAELSHLVDRLAGQKNFQIERHLVELTGVCQNCQAV